jgi:hypothetical protein
LSLASKQIIANVHYNISDATDSQVLFLSSKLDDEISRIRTWYSIIAHLDAIRVVFLLLLLALLVCAGVLGVLFLARGTGTEPLTIGVSLASALVAYLAMAIIAAVGAGMNWLKTSLFPIAVFAFGDGEERLKKLHARRQIAGVTVAIPLVLSLSVGLIL